MSTKLNEVVVVDALRTAFGRAGEKGLFWNTRAEDLSVPLLKALTERTPGVTLDMIEDSIWGVTNQVKEQGRTIGRMLQPIPPKAATSCSTMSGKGLKVVSIR